MRQALQGASFLSVEIPFYLRAGREGLHVGVVNIVVGPESLTFFQIGPGSRRGRPRRHHFWIVRHAVLKLAPFQMEPLLFRLLGKRRFLERGIQFR